MHIKYVRCHKSFALGVVLKVGETYDETSFPKLILNQYFLEYKLVLHVPLDMVFVCMLQCIGDGFHFEHTDMLLKNVSFYS
jgi:hypothetical protein